MFKNIPYIQIQGKLFTQEKLEVLCDQIINDSNVQLWEREIYSFIMDFFSSSDTIEVTTSGSTGPPKKISIKKEHMIASAKATVSFFNLEKDDTAWLCLPVKYIAGKMMIVRAIVGGLNLLYSEPNSIPVITEEIKIDFVAMVPNQVFGLLEGAIGKRQLSNIGSLLIGGSGITNKLESDLLLNPSINAWHSYGMTETITHIALREIGANSNNFKPLAGVEVSTNSEGQLIIDAPKIGVDNLVTNDIADILEDGSFIIVGRIDNVVVSGGIKLFLENIESKISHHISQNYFVGGVPDEKLGEKLILFIEGSSMDNNLINKLRTDLQKFEIPKEIVHLPDFLRTDTGKIRRKEIIANYLKM